MSNLINNGKDPKKVSTMSVERAFEYIKEIAINYGMLPGERINEVEVANTLNMSRVPVREALNRLLVGGFVTFEPGKGFSYRRFSETEMSHLYSIRLDLETSAIRQACQLASDEDISAILSKEKSKDLLNYHTSISKDELILHDEAFHVSVASLSGNLERVRILQNIYERTRFIRKINIEDDSRRCSFLEEHIKIAEAILKHDEKLAVELLDYHLGLNSKELKSNILKGMLRIYKSDIV